MNAKGSFNCMIDIIENGVDHATTSEEILNELLSQHVLDKRTLAEIFKFLTGMPVIAYIKHRQMMRSYLCLVQENGSIDDAIAYSGLDNLSSFDKKFRTMFNLTPSAAKRARNMSLYHPPLTWDSISDTDDQETHSHEPPVTKPVLRFGIEKDKLDNYEEAKTLQSLYGFSDSVTELAFEFAQNCNLTLPAAFNAIDECMDTFFDPIDFSIAHRHFLHEATKLPSVNLALWYEYIANIKDGLNFVEAFAEANEMQNTLSEAVLHFGSYEDYMEDGCHLRSLQNDT